MSTAVFLMAIGLPASGKDTFYDRELKGKNWVHISSDKIREEVYSDVNDQTHNDKVFEIMYKRTKEALDRNEKVYYNATNLSQKRRIYLLNSLNKAVKAQCLFHCIIFPVSYKECLLRNSIRNRVVPEYAMERMYKSFQPPHWCEGWDKIYSYGNHEHLNIWKIFDKALTISHDNPHHTLTIGEHMRKAKVLYDMDNPIGDNLVSTAIYLHDIGKPFCKVFHSMKGKPTDIAHYYNHENVGAYDVLAAFCNDKEYVEVKEDIIEISNLIAHHMDKFKSEAYMNKIHNLYGDKFYNRLLTINHYDLLAH